MQPCSRRNATRIAIALVASTMVGGCATVGQPDVAIRQISADIVFGVTRPEPVVAPANFPVAVDAVVADDAFPDQPMSFAEVGPPPRSATPPVPVVECPTAGVNDFAKEEAPLGINAHRPVEGAYRWKREGTRMVVDQPPIILGGLEQHLVFGFEDGGDDKTPNFSFKTLQPDLVAGEANVFVETSWRVQDNTTARVIPPAGGSQLQGTTGEKPFRVGPGGVQLTAVRRLALQADGSFVTLGSFSPQPAITFIPNPISIGQRFVSAGTDPVTMQTFENDATVTRKVQVDACGERVDGLEVVARQTVTNGPSVVEREVAYVVATQYGGILIQEQVKGVGPGGTVEALLTLGQVTPSALPATGVPR